MNSRTGESSMIRSERTRLVTDRYDRLPLAAQIVVSRREWQWMAESERVRLVSDMCTPPWIDRC